MIHRVKVTGYKSLENVEICLQPLSVLFGPNAAGKSNFLDSLQLLSRLVTARTLREAFEPPYRGKPLESFTFGDRGIESLLEQDSARFSLEVDVKISDAAVRRTERQIAEMKGSITNGRSGRDVISHRHLRYKISVEIRPRSGMLQVIDESLQALSKNWEPLSRRPFFERNGEKISLRMEGQAHPTYFDVGLDHSIVSKPHYPPHFPHVTAFRRELEGWQFFYFEPRQLMRAANGVKEVRHIGLMGEELAAFLNTLKVANARQFRALERAIHSIIPSITGIQTEVNKFGEVELSLVEGGRAIPARVLSEGTLRVLGLLSLSGANETPSVIGFEEPENGIHPRRIQDIAELLSNRTVFGDTQVIVTTHSAVLPDMIDPSSLFVCRREDGQTKINPFSDWGPLWKKSSVEDALQESPLRVSERMMRGDFET